MLCVSQEILLDGQGMNHRGSFIGSYFIHHKSQKIPKLIYSDRNTVKCVQLVYRKTKVCFAPPGRVLSRSPTVHA